jgi:GNAT superfamily N-acetyltransferase
MTRRRYPGDPVGTGTEPPVSFTDREDRDVVVEGYGPGDPVPEPLVEMYEAFDPADRAQGIPPSGESGIREWLAELFDVGYNVVAWHRDRVAGHATLVPEQPAGDGRQSERESQDEANRRSEADEPVEQPSSGPAHELAIFVRRDYQRAGIGTQLLSALLGFGAVRGVNRVWLTVEPWNRAAIGLYEDVGFETVDSRTFEREMSLRLR